MLTRLSIVAAAAFVLISADVANAQPARSANWLTNARAYRSSMGRTITFRCPPLRGRRSKAVYGSNPYTIDSGVCWAGVHSGRLTRAGGYVTIRIIPGRSRYVGSRRYGKRSLRWGRYHTSFRVIRGRPLGGVVARPAQPAVRPMRPRVAARNIGWLHAPRAYRGRFGTVLTYRCRPAPRRLTKAVWGSGFYTIDSGVCKAALHAGRIGRAGGIVRIRITRGRKAYYPSYKRGIRSKRWGRFHTSFIFL